ncbi:MAG: hypothetical protein ABL929_10695 [Ferruginibacter sp.]
MRTKNLSRHSKWWTLPVLAVTLFFSSCQKQELTKEAEKNLTESSLENSNLFSRTGDGIPFRGGTNMLLGELKKNPYTIANMTTAWQNLASRGINFRGETSVYTTHLYVKFKPQNSDQYEQLHNDSTLGFSDYPIESTVIQNGDYYHDPSLPDSVPTYQYTSVKADYQFPKNIPYEIIDKLYIPETDNVFQYETGGTNDLFVNQLLNQAYTQTGNYEDTIALDNQPTTTASRYTPGGQIRVFDTRLQRWIGMEGVRVQARRWFVIYNGYPDFNGNYRMAHNFTRPCNYSIWFATNRFSVRHNVVNTTFWVNGPHVSGDWNYDLNNEYQRFAGHVFRGAYRYNHKDIGGLQRPYLPWRQVYVAVDGSGNSQGVNWVVLPVIRVWRYNGSFEHNSDDVFSTTCHETGHTSHVRRMGLGNGGVIQYWQVSKMLQESWPIAIEWHLTHIEYADRGIANYGEFNYIIPAPNTPGYPNEEAYQYWFKSLEPDYTTIYINLVDNFNESTVYMAGASPLDIVTGYTFSQIETVIIPYSYGLSSLSTQLKSNKPAGVTDLQIDNLLEAY